MYVFYAAFIFISLMGSHSLLYNDVTWSPWSPTIWLQPFQLTTNKPILTVYHYPFVGRIFNHNFSSQMVNYTDSVSMPCRHRDTLTRHSGSGSGQWWWANQRRSETLHSCETSPVLASISSAIFLLPAPIHPLWCRVGDWQPQETLKYHMSILVRSRRCACLVIWFVLIW